MRPNHLIPFVLLSLLFYVDLSAQIRIGGHIGGSLSKYTLTENPPLGTVHTFRGGFFGGLAGEISIASQVAIVLNLNYVQEGTNTDVPDIGGHAIGKIVNSYLEVPLFVQYSFRGSPVTYTLSAGPALGFLLSSYSAVDVPGLGTIESSSTTTFKKQISDLGIRVGAEYPVNVDLAVTIGATYRHGLSKVYDLPSTSHARTFEFSVGVLFSP